MHIHWKATWSLVKDLFREVSRDRIGLIAAGIAFYGLLSLFPGIAAMMALGGLLTQPSVLVDQMRELGAVLPPEASKIIIDQAVQIAGSQDGGLGLAAAVGLFLAIYAASKAAGSLVSGIHIAAGEPDRRGFLAGSVFTLAMTVVAIGLALLAIFSTVVIPAVLAALQVEGVAAWILGFLRWPIMGVIIAFGLGLFYRLSVKDRPPPPWFTPGALVGAAVWLVGSVVFSIYVQNFANYNKTFGTLGGVISLLVWMWLSAYIILFGEELNALLEDRKRRATDSPPRPGAVSPTTVPG